MISKNPRSKPLLSIQMAININININDFNKSKSFTETVNRLSWNSCLSIGVSTHCDHPTLLWNQFIKNSWSDYWMFFGSTFSLADTSFNGQWGHYNRFSLFICVLIYCLIDVECSASFYVNAIGFQLICNYFICFIINSWLSVWLGDFYYYILMHICYCNVTLNSTRFFPGSFFSGALQPWCPVKRAGSWLWHRQIDFIYVEH